MAMVKSFAVAIGVFLFGVLALFAVEGLLWLFSMSLGPWWIRMFAFFFILGLATASGCLYWCRANWGEACRGGHKICWEVGIGVMLLSYSALMVILAIGSGGVSVSECVTAFLGCFLGFISRSKAGPFLALWRDVAHSVSAGSRTLHFWG